MTKQQEEFVALCAQLRLLGASEVMCGAMTAKFEGRARPVAPAAPPREEKEQQQPLDPEQAMEAQYARELGRAPPTTK